MEALKLFTTLPDFPSRVSRNQRGAQVDSNFFLQSIFSKWCAALLRARRSARIYSKLKSTRKNVYLSCSGARKSLALHSTVGAETCGGAEIFSLLICFQSDPPPPPPPPLLFLLPPSIFFTIYSLSPPRSLVSWAICLTRWAGLTASSSCRTRGGKVTQSFVYCSDFSRTLRFRAGNLENAQICASCSASSFPAAGSRSLESGDSLRGWIIKDPFTQTCRLKRRQVHYSAFGCSHPGVRCNFKFLEYS